MQYILYKIYCCYQLIIAFIDNLIVLHIEYYYKYLNLEVVRMKIYTNKKRIIISLALLIALLLLILFNFDAYWIEEKFNVMVFALSILVSIISCALFAIKIEFSNKCNKIITIISFIISNIFCYSIIELLNQNNLFSLYSKRLVFNFIVIILLHLFIYSISNKISLSIILSNLIIFILGTVNYTVTCFRGTPLVPWDILSIKTAAYVATSYSFTFNYYFLLAALLFLLIISIGFKASYKIANKNLNIIFRFSNLLIIPILTITFYKTNIIDYFDFENNLWKPMDEYSNNGFLASFVKQSKNLFNDEPENYSLQSVQNILFKLENNIYETRCSEQKPNIIVIMNESFSDLNINRQF